MTKFTYTLNSGCLKCDGEYIEVGDKLDLTLLPQPSLPVWASEIRVIVTDVFSNNPTSLELEYDETLLGGYILGSCNINGLPKCVDCCTELFEITEDHEDRIVALEAKVDNDTTYTLTASPDNLGATSYTITLTGSDGTTSSATVNVGADSVIVGGTYTPSGGTITVPIQRMSTGGVLTTVGFVNLDVSSFQTGNELVLDTVTIDANGNYVYTDNQGNVIDTVPTESFNSTTGILTLTDGTTIDLNDFPSPDAGSYAEEDVGDCVETTHTSSNGTASTTYERPKHYSGTQKSNLGGTNTKTMTALLPYTDAQVIIENGANLVGGGTPGSPRINYTNPSSKLTMRYKLDFSWRVRIDVAQDRYDAGILHKSQHVFLEARIDGGAWQRIAYESYDRQGANTNGESVQYSLTPASLVGTIAPSATLTVDTRVVLDFNALNNTPVTTLPQTTVGQVLINPPSVAMIAVTTE